MWNEYMEWVDEWDNPIPIPDEDDDDDEQPVDKFVTIGALVISAGIVLLGSLTGNAIIKYINKRKEKDESETHETTERLRANSKDHKQETTESLPGNGDSREDS